MTNLLLATIVRLEMAQVAALSELQWREMIGVGAVLLTLVGVRLCWRAPRHRMSIEERAKDGALTEDEAREKIRFMAWFGPALTVIGCGLVAAAILS